MNIFRYLLILVCLLTLPSIGNTSDIADLQSRMKILGKCLKNFPEGPEREECKKEMDRTPSVFNCQKLSGLEKVGCYKDLSDQGKEEASY